MKELRVLEALMGAEGMRGIPLLDLSKETGIPQSSMHRILKTLASHGLAMQTNDRRYSIGPALIAVGLSSAQEWGMHSIVQEALDGLASAVGEESYLTMRIGYSGVFVQRHASPRPIRVVLSLFERLPLHCGASRKVLLAYAGDQFISDYLTQEELIRYTDMTITDPDELRAELARIVKEGYSISRGERSEGVGGIAAPVVGPWDRVIASVSTLFPLSSLSKAGGEAEMVDKVRAAAREISDRLRSSLPR